jgi:hypothetical protein
VLQAGRAANAAISMVEADASGSVGKAVGIFSVVFFVDVVLLQRIYYRIPPS